MGTRLTEQQIADVVAFHGHVCPGVSTGLRVSEVVLRELGPHAKDEELVAVIETDNCAVDAIQYLTGCTFGKGNLIHLDHGQNVFTFSRRNDGRTLRVTVHPLPARDMSPVEQAAVERARSGSGSEADQETADRLWQERVRAVLDADEKDLLTVEVLEEYAIPDRASIHPSVVCDRCGTSTMAPLVIEFGGQQLCAKCYRQEVDALTVLSPIGVARNDQPPGTSTRGDGSIVSDIEIRPEYADAMADIRPGDRLQILFRLQVSGDVPLKQHPQGDHDRPKKGVFSLRSQRRPNRIGLTAARVLSVEDLSVRVKGLDCWDGTAILDIKPYSAGFDALP